MKKSNSVFVYLLLLLLLAACTAGTPTDIATPTAVPEGTTAEEEELSVIQTREPDPTATPGVITTEVERLFGQPEATKIFGLDTADWVNL